ncbi:N-(5'-phosphoribosyl)anthranilate isomerase (plasmid) [Escherichia coli]|uniref:phosphoribosylanthranilate isomerase n=1 Tax=Escherichia coli TaxID=562 RepID=UPI0038601101
MPAKIKICGISTPEALDATIAARADYAGLVFYPASPRAVTSNVAGALTSRAAGQIAMVGLFVDADDAVIADALVAAKLNALQLHGSDRPNAWPSCARGLASRCGRRCPSPAPAMSHAPQPMPGRRTDLVRAQDPQRRAARRHGVGVRLVAAGRISRCLAVGAGRRAHPTNVAEAIARTGAPLVDTSSGVESAPGVKDTDKITNFAFAVRLA